MDTMSDEIEDDDDDEQENESVDDEILNGANGGFIVHNFEGVLNVNSFSGVMDLLSSHTIKKQDFDPKQVEMEKKKLQKLRTQRQEESVVIRKVKLACEKFNEAMMEAAKLGLKVELSGRQSFSGMFSGSEDSELAIQLDVTLSRKLE
jgi:hypothetical protein